MRVLVVEDERRIADFLSRGLSEQGYAVDVAYDGEEALDWPTVAQFDVIVLDVMLPASTRRENRSSFDGGEVWQKGYTFRTIEPSEVPAARWYVRTQKSRPLRHTNTNGGFRREAGGFQPSELPANLRGGATRAAKNEKQPPA
jgi:DNA-binding NarL/FixJ family response regulator